MRTPTSTFNRLFFLSLLLVGLAVSSGASALAQAPSPPEARIEGPAPLSLFVVGRDATVPVKAQLPAACRGQSVEVALYDRDGPSILGIIHGTVSVTARVSQTGAVEASVSLPKTGLRSAWPGVSGACLAEPLVSQRLGIILGLLDEARNGKNGATFVVPKASLSTGNGLPVARGTLTAVMNGTNCATVDVADARAKDAKGDLHVRVGGAGQPAGCSTPGTEVVFVNAEGQTLFERRTFVPGVTQPFANLAPEPAPNTGSVPVAPATGSARSTAQGDGWPIRLGLAGLALAAGTLALMKMRRSSR